MTNNAAEEGGAPAAPRNFCPECGTRRRTREGQKRCHECNAVLHTRDCGYSNSPGAECTCGAPAEPAKK